MKTLIILGSVMVFLLLTAPNEVHAQKTKAGIPAESTVNTFLQSRITSQSVGAISLTSFRKINGYAQGSGNYVIEWQAEILFQQECWKPGDNLAGYWQDFGVFLKEPQGLETLLAGIGSAKHFNKGTSVRLEGNAYLRETEKGWRVEELMVSNYRVLVSQAPTQLYVAPNGVFSYRPPSGWNLIEIQGWKFKVATLKWRNSNPNISIVEAPFSGTLSSFATARMLEQTSVAKTNGYDNFGVLSRTDFITNDNQRGIRTIAGSSVGGVQIRFLYYFFDGKNGTAYYFVCMPPPEEGAAFDKIFDESMKTFKSSVSKN